tara:strand:+ start:263 stop:1153 length:891 start_codon:yes stop_codon:yes gene_type:complete
MKISIIGTNGLLSNSIGRYCNENGIKIEMYGRSKPKRHDFNAFFEIDLLNEELSYEQIKSSDIIIYAVGAGIQSNLQESADIIYSLNVSVPVKIINELKIIGFSGSFVTFGSYFEIGENTENQFFTENELLQSQNRVVNDYSISKRMFSRFISSVEQPFKTWHFILPTIYGEQESAHRLIPYTINALKTNADIEFTSGEQVRQYIYIAEIAEIIMHSLNKNISSGVYNVAGTESLTVKELVTSLFNLFNKEVPESVFGKAKRTDTGMKILQLGGSKLYNAIDYNPHIKISDVYDKY